MRDRQTDREADRDTEGSRQKEKKTDEKKKQSRWQTAREGENTQKEGKGRTENDLPHRPQNFRQLMRAQDLY